MVIDELALPLQRAWCLFEVLQTQLRATHLVCSLQVEENAIPGTPVDRESLQATILCHLSLLCPVCLCQSLQYFRHHDQCALSRLGEKECLKHFLAKCRKEKFRKK